jgi:glutamate--cysteine ligase
MNTDFVTPGYAHFELSTQLVIAEALKRDLDIEVLDERDQFISISDGDRTEYIQQATRTSLDSYITSLILGNKWVSKELLKRAGISVPEGFLFGSVDAAIADIDRFEGGDWVIKPKTTNFGVGISILKNMTQDLYVNAIDEAFKYDEEIIVERFFEGKECRFLVIGDDVVGVLYRVPANVFGDGESSISELVELKNQHAYRGKGYTTPLEKIELGSVELNQLKTQGLTVDSIPDEDVIVFLRNNSNISTGGDSVDYTDHVHPGYLEVALSASRASGATICGVDMMLNALSEPPTPENHTLIEVNYNPVLYFHDFPFEGKNRHSAGYLLDALGF